MYLCDICSAAFDEPLLRTVRNGDGEHTWQETEALCPVCGTENHFRHAAPCPCCSGYMAEEEALCPTCRRILQGRFATFLAELHPAEAEQLDNWLDGDTIQNHTRWR